MIKKELFIALMVITVFLISACDVYNTLYVKQPGIQGEAVTVPEGNITIEVIEEEVEEEVEVMVVKDKVIRVEGEQSQENLEKMVYGTAELAERDLFKLEENPLGPFEKGEALGFTLGEWLEATGSGEYRVDGDEAELDLEFENLVPNGVYTVWCSRIVLPPDFEIIDVPCGAEDGSENTVEADSDGDANFELEIDPIEPSTEEETAVLALAYHSDGKTFGENPGDFGLQTHVQIFYMMPVLEEEEEKFELDLELVNHIEAGLPEQDVFIEFAEVMEEKPEVEEEVEVTIDEEEIETEDAVVIIVEETELVNLVPKAEDPDQDTLIFTFTSPLDENGEWQTTYGDAGEYTITVTVSDGTLTASREVLVIVNKKEESPVLDSFSPQDTAIDIDETEAANFQVTASDLNNDDLTFNWKLDGIVVSNEQAYTFESTFDDSGSHTVKVTVSDQMFDTEKIWAVTVNNVNRKPVLEEIDDVEVDETDTIVIELQASDLDGDEISYEIDNDRFVQDGNVFTWETTFDDSGEYAIAVTVTDGSDSTTQEVIVTIVNVNRPPQILDIIQG